MFGETIYKIRKSKNMTLKEVAGDVISISQLSRFENGLSVIPVDIFYEMLINLNTSTDEFNYIMNQEKKDILASYFNRIETHANNLEYDKLTDLVTEIKNKRPKPYSWEQFIIYFIQSLLAIDSDVEEKIAPAVLDYLLQVEDWGEMELRIYALFGFALDIETTHFLMRTALKRSKQYLAVPSTAKLLYIILSNNFSTFLAYNYIDYAEETINLFEENYAKNAEILSPHIDFMFNKGLLAYKKNKPLEGKKYCEQAIGICKDFHQSDYEKIYQSRYDNWRKKYKDPGFKEITIQAGFFA